MRVIVLGGGLMGSAAAFFLARRDLRVTLLERNRVGTGATVASFGNIRRSGRYLPQLPLAHRSRTLWGEAERLLGRDVEFRATGHLRRMDGMGIVLVTGRSGTADMAHGLSLGADVYLPKPLELPVLVKTKGKTTTDHISPAGKWLRFRGHLDRISDNMFLGASNAFTGETGKGTDLLSGETGLTFAQIARHYKAEGLSSIVIGDENYGEGSSREHAAMSPRYLGVKAVIARSFARIHETNLKKQGLLPLTFADPADWERIGPRDRVSLLDLASLAPGRAVPVRVQKPDGTTFTFQANHTLTPKQIEWIQAGSALNALGR